MIFPTDDSLNFLLLTTLIKKYGYLVVFFVESSLATQNQFLRNSNADIVQ